MDLTIPPETVSGIVSAAILNKITVEDRNTLIEAAILHLLTPPKKNPAYGATQQPSPLQAAFNIGVQRAANDLVSEQVLSDDRIKARIKEWTDEAVAKLVSEDYGELDQALGQAMGSALVAHFRRD